MSENAAVMLTMLAHKMVHPAVNPHYMAYCPTMDLIALATVDQKVHVYRLNGQKVFGVTSKQPGVKVNQIKWKPNGQILAVAFSNNIIYLTNSHTGKLTYQLDCSSRSISQICSIGWGVNFVDLQQHDAGKTLDDLLSQRTQPDPSDSPPNLPKDLASLDIEEVLPKLSSLSFGGKEENVFNSRASLDSLFQPRKESTADLADMLAVGFEDGTVHLSIYDFFEVGSFSLQQASSVLQNSKPLLHCYHPHSTTHAFIASKSVSDHHELFVVPLDLRLVSSAGRYLSLLAAKSTQLHNILRYIQQVEKEIISEYKAAQELPSKFLRNIEEALKERSSCTWVEAAYHLVVTGNCYPEVKEWLVDELGERGHKRWEKATTAGYENVRRLAHENLLPALERFSVLVSRLRGLSKFQESNMALGLSTHELEALLSTVSSLQLLAHHILISANSELRQFAAFSAWLRREIEVQSTEPSSTSSHDSVETDVNIDHISTLDYLQGPMLRSRLADFFNIQTAHDARPKWDLATEGNSLYESYKKEINAVDQNISVGRQTPGLNALIMHLGGQCNVVFTRIAETQRRHVRFGTPIPFGRGVPTSFDMRMVKKHPNEAEEFILYVALGPSSGQANASVRICRIELSIENGVSSTRKVEFAFVKGVLDSVEDLKFADDTELIIAGYGQSSYHLLSIFYNKQTDSTDGLTYSTTSELKESNLRANNPPNVRLPVERNVNHHVRHTFPRGLEWAPEKIEINGRKGRRIVCVLAKDKINYRIYDIDSANEQGEAMADDEAESRANIMD